MRAKGFLVGAAVGGGIAYFLDKDRGKQRREAIRDRYEHLVTERVHGGEERRPIDILERSGRATG